MKTRLKPLALALSALAVAGCSMPMSRPDVPAALAVPMEHKPVMTLKGVGMLTYECRAKAGTAGGHEWVFAGPDAALQDMRGVKVGRYYGGPTWEHADGSKVTGKQLAVSPGMTGAIPLQVVQASPAGGSGTFTNVTYIQRVNTMGGVAPNMPCDASTMASKQTVAYSADYVFYKR